LEDFPLAKSKDPWRNRIIGQGEEDPSLLMANPSNWRIHPKGQSDALNGVLNEVGWVQQIIVNRQTGNMIDGHLRVSLAIKKEEKKVPVLYVDLSQEEEKIILATIDPISSLAITDEKKLNELISEISISDEAVNAMLNDLSSSSGDIDIEDLKDPAPDFEKSEELQKKYGIEIGQLWELGENRIICGDSTSKLNVETLIGDNYPILMVTDPPYGVEYDPTWRDGVDKQVGKRSKGKVLNDNKADWREAWGLFPGDIAYVWHGGVHAVTVAESLIACGFNLRSQIIWVKQHFVFSRGDYHWQHEPCWYAVRKNRNGNWTGDRSQTTTWFIKNNNPFGNDNSEEKFGHGTQKPVECMARPIVNNTKVGEYVYDPFLGSGTTLIACEQLKRKCLGVELSTEYVAMAIQRWADITGGTPILKEKVADPEMANG
jgi:DNA modification methylase